MLATGGGQVQHFKSNGVPTGVAGTITPQLSSTYTFNVARTDGHTGVIMLSADKMHMLYIDSALTFGAWEKNAAALAPPYTVNDVVNSAWQGSTATIGPAPTYEPRDVEPLEATIALDASFTEQLLQGGVTMSSSPPQITLLDGANGQYGGAFTTNGTPPAVGAGPILMLVTPDRLFMAVQYASGTTWPDDVRYSAWGISQP
jgi:hypothetical protein